MAAYCAVADVLTPVRSYDAHERTYLDWTYAVDPGYVPPDLVAVASGATIEVTPFALPQLTAADLRALPGEAAYGALLVDDPNAAVRRVMLPDLRALRAAAAAAGVPLVVLSAYRSYAHQAATFDHWVSVGGYEQALRTSARPGHSEHQLGTAIDFGDGRAAPWEYRDWATTPSGAWLRDRAAEFGFVMSYPPGKSGVTCYDYEPWHYRWIGRSAAAALVSTGVTLREWQTVTR